MAKLTRDDILKLARLSRLKLSEKEITNFQTDISNILGYVEMLNESEVTGLKPTYQVSGLTNVTRNDEIINYSANQTELLKNVPSKKDSYIKVKRMIG